MSDKVRRHFTGAEKVCDPQLATCSTRSPFPPCARNSTSTPPSSTPGSRNSSRTATPPSTTAVNPRPPKTPRTRRSSSSKPNWPRRTKSSPSCWRPTSGEKKSWGDLSARWVPHDSRDQIVDFIRDWTGKTELPACGFFSWLGLCTSKFHDWKNRFGKVNEHNGLVPRDHWLTDDEKDRIQDFARRASARRLSPTHLHDARRRRGRL